MSDLPFYMRFRWIFICFFLLPFNFLRQTWRLCFRRRPFVTPEEHMQRMAAVARRVRSMDQDGNHQRLVTDRDGNDAMALRQNLYKHEARGVSIKHLNRIVSDGRAPRDVLVVEPFVTVGQLTEYLIPLGYTLPVVPELDDLTVGGLIMGVGLETSSHLYGTFADNVSSMDMVTGNGALVRASRDQNSELFHALPWSYGSIGFVVSVTLRLKRAMPWVKLTYRRTVGVKGLVEELEKRTEDADTEFVEGLLFGPSVGVVITGRMTDSAPKALQNRLAQWYKPWYYVHAYDTSMREPNTREYVPLRDYYHRHSRSIFWQMAELVPFGNQAWFRYLFGWLLPVPISTLKRTTPDCIGQKYQQLFAFQDMLVPLRQTQVAIEGLTRLTGIYPVWVCPFLVRRHTSQRPFVAPVSDEDKEEMFVDIGLYGQLRGENSRRAHVVTPACEDLVADLGGYQMLWAETYQTFRQFRRMYSHELLDSVRRNYGAVSRFPSVFDKVRARDDFSSKPRTGSTSCGRREETKSWQ